MRIASLATLSLLTLAATACGTKESRQMKELAGEYVRTFRPGVEPVLGLDGTIDRHTLILTADGRYRTTHPPMSIQQFDVPMDSGTYRVGDVGIVLRSADPETGVSAAYTIGGDTLYPKTTDRQRMGEMVTGFSMQVGELAYLVRIDK